MPLIEPIQGINPDVRKRVFELQTEDRYELLWTPTNGIPKIAADINVTPFDADRNFRIDGVSAANSEADIVSGALRVSHNAATALASQTYLRAHTSGNITAWQAGMGNGISTGIVRWEILVQNNDSSDVRYLHGLKDSITAAGTAVTEAFTGASDQGCYFFVDSSINTNWQASIVTNGVHDTVDTGIVGTFAPNRSRLRIEKVEGSTTIEMYVNDGLVHSGVSPLPTTWNPMCGVAHTDDSVQNPPHNFALWYIRMSGNPGLIF